MRLTEHFTLEEAEHSEMATVHGVVNRVPDALMGNVQRAAAGMERVREMLGGPILVSSWYRCPKLNALLRGAAKTSAHMEGWAVDFICPQVGPPAYIVERLQSTLLEFDQLIQEGTWVHVSFSPLARRIVLTAHFTKRADGTIEKVQYTKGA